MATRKPSGGNTNRNTNRSTNRSTTATRKRKRTASGTVNVGGAQIGMPRRPNKSDSLGYKLMYGLFVVAILGYLAWSNGYLDTLIEQTPIGQYVPTSGQVADAGSGPADASGNGQVIATEGAIDPNTLDTTWSVEKAPDYYVVLDPNDAHLDFTVEKGQFVYTGWDELGRTLRVYGCPTHETWSESAGWRADMPSSADRISGWGHNENVTLYNSDGSTYKSSFYNRSHLIGDACGAATIPENLICASRQQNVGQSNNKGGMRYTENITEEYLKTHEDGYVYYSATPIYVGDELLARAVYVQIQSDDMSINQAVLVYNAAYGYEISYADGTFRYVGI